MNHPKYHSEQHRDQIRGFILGTLGEREHALVEDYIRTDPEWATALETQRSELARLDVLEPVRSERDLTQAVLDRLDSAEEPRLRRSPSFRPIALAFALLAILLAGSILMTALSRIRESDRQQLAENNMKQLGLAFKMYANVSAGEKLPPLAPYDDIWMFDVSVLYPEYISDLSILVSPELSNARQLVEEMGNLIAEENIDWERITRIASMSYAYASWAVEDPDDVEAMLKGRAQLAETDYDRDMEVGDKTLYRLREGIERFLITDINNPGASAMAQSNLPILLETSRVASRRTRRRGANVLYLDGHTETHSLSADTSIARDVIDLLLDRLNAQDR